MVDTNRRKVALVSGGGQGIGAAISLKLAELGYRVGIIGRSKQALAAHAADLGGQGYQCEYEICDVSDWDQVTSAVDRLEEKLGIPTVLVNNAGGWVGDPIETIDVSRFRALIDATIMGTMHLSKAVIPAMRRNQGGFILNIGSTSGLPSTRDAAAASAPKAAIDVFTRALGNEVASYGIKVAVLHPARVNKKLSTSESESRSEDGLFKNLSLRQVSEIAAFIIEQPENVLIRELIVTPANIPL